MQAKAWTLGWDREIHILFEDNKILWGDADRILYPEYFDENGEPLLDKLPMDRGEEWQ